MITITLLSEARLYKTVETTVMVTVLDSLQWLEKSRKINDKDVVLCWHFHFLPFSQKVAPCVLKGNHSFFIVAVTKVSINHGQDGSVIVKTAILLGPGYTKQNFIFFLPKKSVNRKPFLVWIVFFFSPNKFSQMSPKFKDAVKKIWRRTIFGQVTNAFVP